MRPVIFLRQIHEHGTEWVCSMGGKLGGSLHSIMELEGLGAKRCLDVDDPMTPEAYDAYRRMRNAHSSEDL